MELDQEQLQMIVRVLSVVSALEGLTAKENELLTKLKLSLNPWMDMSTLSAIQDTEIITLSSPNGVFTTSGVYIPKIYRLGYGIPILQESDGKPIFMDRQNFSKWKIYEESF